MRHASKPNPILSDIGLTAGRAVVGQLPSWAQVRLARNSKVVSKPADGTASDQLSGEPMASGEALLHVNDVAEQLGVSTKTIRRILARRELPFLRIGRLIRVRQSDLISYLIKCNILLYLLCFILYRYYLLC